MYPQIPWEMVMNPKGSAQHTFENSGPHYSWAAWSLKTEAPSSSATWVTTYQSTQHHNLEHLNLYQHSCENLKSIKDTILKSCFIGHNVLRHRLSTMFLKKILLWNGTVQGETEATWHLLCNMLPRVSNMTLMPFCRSSSFLTHQITDPGLHDLLHNLWTVYLHFSS